MNKPTKKLLAAAVSALLLAMIPIHAIQSTTIETGNDIQFTSLHRLDDDVYAFSGKNISMDGFIDGDFTVFTNSTIVNGEITGNGNFFCRQLDHNGKINRTLHVFAESANINGIVSRSAIAFCSEFILSSNGLIERDLTVMGARADIGGTVKGNVTIYADEVRLFGVIDGNVNIEARSITITAPAVIMGNLTYTSEEEVRIDTVGGVVIAGTVEGKLKSDDKDDESEAFRTVVVTISELLAAFLFGLLILIPFRRHVNEAVVQLSDRFVVSLASGFVTVLVFMFAIVVALLSLTAFLIGYALVSGDAPAAGALVLILSTIILPISSFSAISGGILFYLGKIILAFLIGNMIVSVVKKGERQLSKTKLILGLVALAIVFEIPYLGMVIYLLGSLTGAGAIVLAVRKINFELSGSRQNDEITSES